MTDDTRRRTSRKVDVRAEVRGWLKRGVRCVPIAPRKKKPKGGEGWNKLRVTESTIDDHFSPGDNFGGLWGEPSGGVIDIDLDWPESVLIAAELLPSTYIYGRMNRPRTHYLYRCEGIKTTKFKSVDKDIEGDKQTIIEIRSTGTQSVLPGSIHEEGDQYTVDEDQEFRVIGIEQLTRYVRHIAALSAIANEYPEGGGHDYVAAFTGALMHSGWSKDDVRLGCRAILRAVGPLEDHPEQRVRTINSIIEKHDSSTTPGWPTLGEHISSARVLEQIKKWCDVSESSSEPMPTEVKAKIVAGIPMHLMRPPGLVGDIAEWASKRAFLKQPVFDLAVGLMCVAMASRNRYVIQGWDTPLQPYIMLLAPTAAGKESALNSVYDFCRRIRMREYCFKGFQSYHSMLDRLAEDHIACWLWDEAARKLKTAGKGGGSQDYQVMTWVTELYGKGASFEPGLTARGQNIADMDNPFLVIMAASQGKALMDAVTDADLATGVVNRFMLFDAGDDMVEENQQRVDSFHDIFSGDLEKRVMRIYDRPPSTTVAFPFHRIDFDERIYQVFRTFNREARAKALQADIWGRANQNALILAGLVALGMGDRRPIITSIIAEWAIAVVRWSISGWEARMEGSVSSNLTEASSKKVEDIIRNARKHSTKGPRPSHVELLKKGIMTRTVLTKLCRDIESRRLDDILKQLKAAEIIGEGTDPGGSITTYWVLG